MAGFVFQEKSDALSSLSFFVTPAGRGQFWRSAGVEEIIIIAVIFCINSVPYKSRKLAVPGFPIAYGFARYLAVPLCPAAK
jgi:hypothetical protein